MLSLPTSRLANTTLEGRRASLIKLQEPGRLLNVHFWAVRLGILLRV
jgi:hypothetical protein